MPSSAIVLHGVLETGILAGVFNGRQAWTVVHWMLLAFDADRFHWWRDERSLDGCGDNFHGF